MSDNKAPVRVWTAIEKDEWGEPFTSVWPNEKGAKEWSRDRSPQLYISAAALRELVEEAERDSEKYGMPYGYTALHGMLKQLLEADR